MGSDVCSDDNIKPIVKKDNLFDKITKLDLKWQILIKALVVMFILYFQDFKIITAFISILLLTLLIVIQTNDDKWISLIEFIYYLAFIIYIIVFITKINESSPIIRLQDEYMFTMALVLIILIVEIIYVLNDESIIKVTNNITQIVDASKNKRNKIFLDSSLNFIILLIIVIYTTSYIDRKKEDNTINIIPTRNNITPTRKNTTNNTSQRFQNDTN